MQAELVTARLTWCDVFAAGRPAGVAVVLVMDVVAVDAARSV